MSSFCTIITFLGVVIFLVQSWLPVAIADCPLNFNASNIALVASTCMSQVDRVKCCRYINAFLAVSNARYANATSSLGVDSSLSEVCLDSISETLQLYGVSLDATGYCGLGTKIAVDYEYKGRKSVAQMLQSPGFSDVAGNCKVSLLEASDCKKCINSSMMYLHGILQVEDNVTLNVCRDATFVALASQADNQSAAEFASCFFGVPALSSTVSWPHSTSMSPKNAPSSLLADGPSGLSRNASVSDKHHRSLTIIPGVATAVTVVSVVLLVALLFLIHRKSRELEDTEYTVKPSFGSLPSGQSSRKIPEGTSPMFRKFSYKEIKKATNNFSTVIGHGGFGTVYKAQFSDGLVAAVKRMDKISEQAEDEFCKEIELLARLHHRHLVALKGFCIERHERLLTCEYMEKGSLKDHLHVRDRKPLSWQMRIQIAIDVANALEYLHFYCDPPLCHRDIKSSNILLDENYVAKVADFGLAHASGGSVFFEPVSTDVRGTPGYMDPEYVFTRELSEKSDVYSYGVLLLELVTSRRAVQDNKNLVEWSQVYMTSDTMLPELVDPRLGDAFDHDQLQTIVTIARWCTEREARARPSIKQVLRLLQETWDPIHSGFIQAVEHEEYGGVQGSRRMSKGKSQSGDAMLHSGEGRYLASSSSTNRSYGSRTFLLENGSPISS
ncbi:hypothetical protein Drorol1_Dr00006948 [Drosera rotundifolia]